MGGFFTALIVIAIIVGNIFRVVKEFRKRAGQEDPSDEIFGESALRRELERRLKEDRDRMAPPSRPGRPATAQPAPRQYTPPPRPVDFEEDEARQASMPAPLARETMAPPPPPPPAPPRVQPRPAPAQNPRQIPKAPKPSPATVTRAAAPASLPKMAQIAPIASGLHKTGTRRRSTRFRPESLTPSVMRKVAVLSEIYNPPLALREPPRP